MAVQVAAGVDMRQANRLPAFDRRSPSTGGAARPSDAPVAVTVLHRRDARHRLLPTACRTESEFMAPVSYL